MFGDFHVGLTTSWSFTVHQKKLEINAFSFVLDYRFKIRDVSKEIFDKILCEYCLYFVGIYFILVSSNV